MVARIGSKARVLEVGSYVGGFLAAAHDAGLDAQGIDVGVQVSDFVRAKGLTVHTGTLQAAQFDAEAFDAVCVWNCFDQIPEPWATVSEIYRLLRTGGWLFV